MNSRSNQKCFVNEIPDDNFTEASKTALTLVVELVSFLIM